MGSYIVSIPDSFGPRILGFRRKESPDLFATLDDDVVLEHPESGVYRFRGGHRLWAAPELPAVTYAPDDEECEVSYGRGLVTLTGPVDRAGLSKRLVVTAEGSSLVVDHTLTNHGPAAREIAPWAITQFRLGGLALMPLGRSESDVQGDRSLTVWPYTDLSDPRLTMDQSSLTVAAEPGPAFKIGVGPNPGRLGYLLDGWLFLKEIALAFDRPYADRGATGQIFVENKFCELESLGALIRLAPGERVSHRELWSLTECDGMETARQRVVAV